MQNLVIKPFKLLVTDRSISFDIVFFSILLILIPFVLITGPALPDIFLSLIALYFLVKSVLQKKWHYYQNPIVIGFLFFSAYGIIRSLFSEMPLQSLTNEGSMFYFRYIFFAMGVWYLLDKNPYLSKCLLLISLICILVVSLDALYQYFMEINFFGNEKYNFARLTGMFGKEPIIGRYITFLSLFTFALIYQNIKKTKKTILLSVAFLVMCDVIVFLTGERAPFFYVCLFSVLIIIFIPHYRFYRIGGFLLSMTIILGILSINPNAKTRIYDTIQEVSETKISYLPYNKGYEDHYISALKLFIDRPLFGVGTNMYRFQCDKTQYTLNSNCNSHPHHFYIQALAELGITGFLFLAIFFLYLCLIGFKQLIFLIFSNKTKLMPFDFFLFPMILFVYWWPLIPHMSLYNNWNNVLIMLPLGFFLRNMYGYKKI